MITFRCPSDILITSWLFTAWWSTWPGNHLVPCVAELVGSCIPIYARRCLPDPKCLFYPSDLSLCLSVDHFCLVPVDDNVVLLMSSSALTVMADLWVTLLSLALEARPWSKVVDREVQRQTRWMKEALWIRKTPICMNRDAGSYQLSHTWDQMISRSRAPSSCKQSRRDQDVRWTSKRCH